VTEEQRLRQALELLCDAVTEHVSPTHRKGMSHAELGARLRKARAALVTPEPESWAERILAKMDA